MCGDVLGRARHQKSRPGDRSCLDSHRAPPGPRRQREHLRAVLVACLAQFAITLDYNAINIALPAIGADLGLSSPVLQWAVTCYTVLFGGCLLVAGRLSDLLGRRPTIALGAVVVAIASVAASVANSGTTLIVARSLVGIGAALIAPSALSLITESRPPGFARDRALGMWGAAMSGGLVVGAVAGGLLTDLTGWRSVGIAIFLVYVALGLSTLGLRPDRAKSPPRRPHLVAGICITASVMLLLVAVTQSATFGLSTRAAGSFIAGVLLAALFFFIERRSAERLLSPTIIHAPGIAAAALAGGLAFGGLAAVLFLMTLYLQGTGGFSSLEVGVAFSVFGAMALASGFAAPAIIRCAGPRVVLAGGLLTQGAGTLSLLLIPGETTLTTTVGAMAILAIGHVTAVVALTAAALKFVPSAHHGAASGLLTSAEEVGAGTGVAVAATAAAIGAATEGLEQSPLGPTGLAWGLAAAVGLCVLGVMVGACGSRRHRSEEVTASR
jgi:MFS family permease